MIAYLEQSRPRAGAPVGNSMGGAISLLVAAQRPDLVRTLTLISPAVPDIKLRAHALRDEPRMASARRAGARGMAALRKLGRLPVETRVQGHDRALLRRPVAPVRSGGFDETVAEAQGRIGDAWADAAMLRSTRGLVRSQFAAAVGADLAPCARSRRRRWWCGATTDKLVAPDLAPYVAAAIPNSRLLVLDDIGHIAMMEDPVTTARAMLGAARGRASDTRAAREPLSRI